MSEDDTLTLGAFKTAIPSSSNFESVTGKLVGMSTRAGTCWFFLPYPLTLCAQYGTCLPCAHSAGRRATISSRLHRPFKYLLREFALSRTRRAVRVVRTTPCATNPSTKAAVRTEPAEAPVDWGSTHVASPSAASPNLAAEEAGTRAKGAGTTKARPGLAEAAGKPRRARHKQEAARPTATVLLVGAIALQIPTGSCVRA
mmetsp:Transcript_168440/g.541265  ORF Transcript_168440/g.541265 Transcript_168440/m.541265 type:complete len:200 (-) Transcript_168440:26-625(-)